MTELSICWPKVGPNDGRAYTDAEWRTIWEACFNNEGVLLDYLNELTASVIGANDLHIDTGAAFVKGAFYHNSAVVSLAPTSAPAGEVRQHSLILEQDHTGGGGTGQYTVRLAFKVGTAGAPPAMTQTVNVLWQMRLYDYQIDDAGAITALTRMCYPSHFRTEVNLDMLLDGVLTANAAGRAKVADQFVNHAKIVVGERWIVGMIMPFSGTFGGADSHCPIDPSTGVADTNWHLCNGDVVGGVTTPNLRDKFIMGAGSTYAAGTSGGAATKSISHTHADTLAVTAHAVHTHNVNITSGNNSAIEAGLKTELGGPSAADEVHTHAVTGATATGGPTTHTVTGSVSAGGSATQDVLNPYYALSYIMRVANT